MINDNNRHRIVKEKFQATRQREPISIQSTYFQDKAHFKTQSPFPSQNKTLLFSRAIPSLHLLNPALTVPGQPRQHPYPIRRHTKPRHRKPHQIIARLIATGQRIIVRPVPILDRKRGQAETTACLGRVMVVHVVGIVDVIRKHVKIHPRHRSRGIEHDFPPVWPGVSGSVVPVPIIDVVVVVKDTVVGPFGHAEIVVAAVGAKDGGGVGEAAVSV